MDHTNECTPKHLRVGVNSALVNDAALARLLIRKGLITLEEYESAIAYQMELEVQAYETNLSQYFGKKITLS